MSAAVAAFCDPIWGESLIGKRVSPAARDQAANPAVKRAILASHSPRKPLSLDLVQRYLRGCFLNFRIVIGTPTNVAYRKG
jgi:hypothetical protein